MSSSNLWISPLIEHCLSSYEENQRNLGLDWENDGSNIRFSSHTQPIAQINSVSRILTAMAPLLTVFFLL